MLRVIREEEPPKPSTRLSTSRRPADARGQPRHGAGQADEAGARRARLDRDEGPGEGPQPPLRDGQRLRDGRAALPGGRAGAGVSAVGGVSAAEVRAAEPGPVWPWRGWCCSSWCCWAAGSAGRGAIGRRGPPSRRTTWNGPSSGRSCSSGKASVAKPWRHWNEPGCWPAKPNLAPPLAERIESLQQLLDAEGRDEVFVAQFEAIRREVQTEVDVEKSEFRQRQAYPKIREALEQYGIAIGVTPPAAAVTHIQKRPAAIQSVVVAALDECLAVRTARGFRYPWVAHRCAARGRQRSLAEQGAAGVEAAGDAGGPRQGHRRASAAAQLPADRG